VHLGTRCVWFHILASSMVPAGATANTTKENSRASRGSVVWSLSHGAASDFDPTSHADFGAATHPGVGGGTHRRRATFEPC